MRALEPDFYDRPVLEVAQALIGCVLVHAEAAGVIVETEAYHESEPACHAFIGSTPRTRILFGAPGTAYVYRSYGIHALFNAVCESEGIGAAVLIRALEPIADLEQMGLRRGRPANGDQLCSGPGKLTQALGITLEHNGADLSAGELRIEARPAGWERPRVLAAPRIGISKAVELPWRFCAAGNLHVSRPRPPAGQPRAILAASSRPRKGARAK